MPRDETLPKLEIVTEIPDKALVIFAHPDDAEIGSGGVVAKWAAAGCEVTYVLCTNGAAGTADRALTPAALTRKRADEPDVIVDVTDSIDRQIAGLIRHESQVPGFNVPEGHTIGERVKKNAAEHAEGYGFQYGAVFRRLTARR
ncbi:MAG: hypothetical protein DMF45_13970 [Verrucomicrobia bacterium]|nr:MAG: hypothetical protein DMF45_13970 [Verrucomicrobiota bacterium]